ncbi:N-acetylmuramoyl-L-alanine amidase [Sphingopyxis panaciterrulae]|uniref:N-acetylmuramoyl-L-alanine amidase n=1 Tax=Sphingopyxis panaciterrulae TaxID=462372 RepID=A0A7W9B3T6_9SPHN|nr:N-acetylmuramoyl-L-alanine amidase [Sphingopyxis panaciterrulae]MBB5705517.1 N-acetylmuramoyl-L-alanine amidase [Sphingopyxis panaciterrulae]
MGLFLLLVATILTAPAALAGAIGAVEVGEGEVTVRFDGLVAGASAFLLAGPDRIALDIAGAQAGRGADGAGLVRAVRQGQQGPDIARVVLDLARPALLSDPRFAADGRSLSFRLRPVSADEFARAARAPRTEWQPPAGYRARPPQKRYSVTVPIGRPKPALPLPKIEGPDNGRLPLVVIDAGHGGHDPGAISPHSGRREKDITLALAKAVRDQLVAGGRVRVALTRADDRFLVLEERYGIARRLKADLFISIHADSAENEEARGASIYTLSEVASDREAAKLAARENKANIINGVDLGAHSGDVSSILLDLTQRETMNVASDFARLLQREAGDQVHFRTDAHRFASFVVLKAPDTPSILFETGFISNRDDADFLASKAGQQTIARGIRDAVQIHFARQIAAVAR